MMGLGIYCVYMDLFFFSLSREEMQLLHFFLLDLLKLYSFTMIAQKHLVSLPYYLRCIFYRYLFFKN